MTDSVRSRGFQLLLNRIVAGDADEVRRMLDGDPVLVTIAARAGATRSDPHAFFFSRIRHYLYAGDTPLHMAAAAYQRRIAELLVARGADVHAKNMHGATALHYAADTNHWDPSAQADTITYLISKGADANVISRLGVTPLHRAVRTRSASAVKALLDGGADPGKKNRSGSTPLRLAALTTGRGGSGSAHARQQQAEIIRLLRAATGAPTDPAYTS